MNTDVTLLKLGHTILLLILILFLSPFHASFLSSSAIHHYGTRLISDQTINVQLGRSIQMQSEPLLLGKSHVFHKHLPYAAHKRLVPYTHMPAPTPHNSVRASVLNNELDRIQHRSRPHFSHVPTEDYLNSRAVVVNINSLPYLTSCLYSRYITGFI